MKTIFLDIDGVVITSRHYRHHENVKFPQQDWLDPEAWANLKELVHRADAAVVISSTWRIYCYSKISRWLEIPTDGYTPVLYGCREVEIDAYIHRHTVSSYVIIDDDPLCHDRFVQTDSYRGLTRHDVEKALEVLCQ